jgi:hypothetical protein
LGLRIGAWSGDSIVDARSPGERPQEKEWTPKRLRKAVATGTNAEKVALLKEIGVLRKDETLATGTWNWARDPTRLPELAG